MAGRFVRSSKYRHVFGRSTKKEQCYDNLHISRNAWDTNLVKVNPKYISVNWEASGGGAFAVIPIEERGKVPDLIPLFRGHTSAVLDTDWSPFDDSLIASASDDGRVYIWKVPEDFTIRQDPENIQHVAPTSKLSGHSRKVGHVLFNPAAANVLASASGDYTIKLWDVEAGTSKLSLNHKDIVQSLSWSADGSMLVTTCRDKKLRVWDVREGKAVVEVAGHSGAKNSRAVWMGEHDRIATTGFSKMSDRQLGLWDIRAAREPLNGFEILDQISGVCMPFWDEGTQCLYLAGKGDGNIRYYEYENDKFEYLSQHSSADPQRGLAFMPKRGVNLHENEILRAFRTVNDSYIEPVSFIVPRRAEAFQNDIYPPATGTKPAMSATDWFDGAEARLPPKINLADVFEGEAPKEVAPERKAATSPIPTHTQPEPAKPAAAPVATPAPPSAPATAEETPIPTPMPTAMTVSKAAPTSMKDNKDSIASMASRFADAKDDDASSDDGVDGHSGFDEVDKPAERPSGVSAAAAIASVPKPASMPSSIKSVPSSSSLAAPEVAAASTEATATTSAASGSSVGATSDAVGGNGAQNVVPSRAASGSGGPAEGLKAVLSDIRAMLEAQGKVMAAQTEKIDALAREVGALKAQKS